MKLEELSGKGKDLQKAIDETFKRRDLWTNEKKTIVQGTLEKVKGFLKIDCHVQNVQMYENYGAVTLSMGKSPSGISGKSPGEKIFVKQGGYLAFSQSYTGKLFVIAGMPYIESITDQIEPIVLTTVDPEEIDESFVLKKVDQFLKKIIQWESGKEYTAVGFKLPGII